MQFKILSRGFSGNKRQAETHLGVIFLGAGDGRARPSADNWAEIIT